MKRLVRADVDAAVETLGAAFFEDSLVSRLCPDQGSRLHCTMPVFRFSANMAVGYGEAWAMPQASQEGQPHPAALPAVALWQYSWRMGCPLWRWVQYGGLDIRRRLGPTAYRELTRISARIDAMRERVAPERYLYLSSLGVSPQHRRQGLARALVQPRVHQAAAEGLCSIVETNSEGALSFYQEVGFVIRAQSSISGLQYNVLQYRG